MRRFLVLTLTFLFLLGAAIPSYAGELTNAKLSEEQKQTRKNVEILAAKYGFQLEPLGKNASVVEVKDLAELENYFKVITSKEEKSFSESIRVPQTSGALDLAKASQNDSYNINWWNPFAGFDGVTLLCWSNVYLEYTYEYVNSKPQFVSVDSVESDITGITTTEWVQRGYVPTITKVTSTNDTAKLKVSGKYVLGITIGGQPIGASRNSTWNCSLTLTPE